MEQSAFGRLVSVLFAPRKTFEAIAARPTWVVAMVVLVLLGTVLGMVAMSKADMGTMMREQGERRGLSEEQMEQQIAFMEKFGTVFALFGTVFAIGAYFLIGLVFWVTFKLLGSELGYMASLSTSLHALVPQGILAAIALPIMLGQSEVDMQALQSGTLVASNAAAFAPEEAGKALIALLSSLDVFSFWTVALLAIGYSIVAKVSRTTAAVTVVVFWVLYVAGKAGLAAAFS
jgi:hypothetical protein